ncbi:MAG: acyl carrier protein [bacterium]
MQRTTNEAVVMSFDEFRIMVAESLGFKKNELREDTSFLYDLGVDSLSLMNFILKLEKEYGIKFELSNIWELKSLKKAYSIFLSAMEKL